MLRLPFETGGAIALYQERKTKKSISNPYGFLIDALRGRWAVSASSVPAATLDLFPAELVKWYEWALLEGIVDGRPPRHCPNASPHSSNERLQVVIPIPPEERCPADLGPFRYVYWRDAIALYPMPEVFELQPDPEIQQLIKKSLDGS